MTDTHSYLQSFLFKSLDIRGQLARINEPYHEALAGHDYAEPVSALIGEALVAAALLSSNLKNQADLTLQAQGDGPLSLLIAECRNNRDLRAVARQGVVGQTNDLVQLLGHGVLTITIDPDSGRRYQGIVPLEQDNLAGCIQDYFFQSEQLQTQIRLFTAPGQVAGLMVQALPQSSGAEPTVAENWNRISQLSATLSQQEIFSLTNEEVLYRLYHEEKVTLYPATELRYKCRCERGKFLRALVSMGKKEIENILVEQEQIITQCEFCNTEYVYSGNEILSHCAKESAGRRGSTLH